MKDENVSGEQPRVPCVTRRATPVIPQVQSELQSEVLPVGTFKL